MRFFSIHFFRTLSQSSFQTSPSLWSSLITCLPPLPPLSRCFFPMFILEYKNQAYNNGGPNLWGIYRPPVNPTHKAAWFFLGTCSCRLILVVLNAWHKNAIWGSSSLLNGWKNFSRLHRQVRAHLDWEKQGVFLMLLFFLWNRFLGRYHIVEGFNPIWKTLYSQIGSFPQVGMKIKNI